MEYAVPRPDLVDVVRELAGAIADAGLRVPFPVEVRVAAADDAWLSTAYRRVTGYVAVHLPTGMPRAAYDEYFGILESLAGACGGRPHGGKVHGLDAAALRDRHPRFADFVAVRDRVDPGGVFANAHLDRILGLPGSGRPG